MEDQNKAEIFSLGITMAGAVSAGCYTAGVMDYLFEILDLWERAKKGEYDTLKKHHALIPNHQVRIDAMGGASAGGMTTTMSAIYALNGAINPVKKPGEIKEVKNNILYDSWVLMDDNNTADGRSLFEKVWDTNDLDEGKFGSLLNSGFIDTIADNAFHTNGEMSLESNTVNLPSYISKDLQLLYSHCFLRGIPLDVNFETPISKFGRKSVIPNHSTFEHYIITQYHLNKGVKPDTDKYLWLNPYEKPYADILKLSTIATGAFPIGLAFREFTTEHLSDKYIRTAIKRVITGEFGKDDPDPDGKIELKFLRKNYSSIAIDGGAINNEPYREVLSILHHQNSNAPADGYPRYGIIMIDPFPDRAQLEKSHSKPNDAIDVAQAIIGTLTDQSRIKRREMLETDPSDSFKSIIFPRKWKRNEDGGINGPPDTITCAAAMAFGGFLDIRFRQHDFFLGRNNARNFFRYFFSFPYFKHENDRSKDDIHPIHRNWTPEMVETFKFEKDGTWYLPIIPDLNILLEKENGTKVGWTDYDIKETPVYDPKELFKLKKAIKRRFRKIFNVLQNRDFTEAIKLAKEAELAKLTEKQRKDIEALDARAEGQRAVADAWIKKRHGYSWLSKIGSALLSPFIGLGIFIGKRIAAKKITQYMVSAILKDLASKDLLKRKGLK